MIIMQPRAKDGTFDSPYDEPRAKNPIAFRLPQSLDEAVRLAAEQQGIDLKDWVVDAVKKKLSS